jgi:hypothetical protein
MAAAGYLDEFVGGHIERLAMPGASAFPGGRAIVLGFASHAADRAAREP